jgi:hypothetical protein
MMGDVDLWLEGSDPFDDPTLAEMLVGAPRPRKGIIICSWDFLERIRPVVCTSTQLVVAQLLYSKCLAQRCRTVSLSNQELRLLGISRYAKYRSLIWLRDAGVITIEETRNGRSIQVTLHWFP